MKKAWLAAGAAALCIALLGGCHLGGGTAEPTVTATGTAVATLATEATDTRWREAYRAVLAARRVQIEGHWKTEEGSVAFADLDGDGVPEMWFVDNEEYDYDGVSDGDLSVYTYEGGAAKRAFFAGTVDSGDFASTYALLLLKNGEFCEVASSYGQDVGHVGETITYYRWREGQIQPTGTGTLRHSFNLVGLEADEEYSYEEGGASVDANRYRAACAQLLDDAQTVVVCRGTQGRTYESLVQYEAFAGIGAKLAEQLTQSPPPQMMSYAQAVAFLQNQ